MTIAKMPIKSLKLVKPVMLLRLLKLVLLTFAISTFCYHSITHSADTGPKKLVQDFKERVESFVEHENQKAKYELERAKFAREQKAIRLKSLRQEEKARIEYLAVRKKQVYPEETASYQTYLKKKAKEEAEKDQIQARYSKNHRELKELESEFEQTLGPAEFGLDNVPRPTVEGEEPQSQF